MDSRSGLAVILVLLGIWGAWLVLTGRFKKMVDAYNGAYANANPAPAAAKADVQAPGTSQVVPISIASNAPNDTFNPGGQQLGTLLHGYAIAVGGDGVKLGNLGDPIGSYQVGGTIGA